MSEISEVEQSMDQHLSDRIRERARPWRCTAPDRNVNARKT
jgi:hypothetical protein